MQIKKRKKILSVVGARPNFVKIAPVLKEFRKYKNIESILVHTGQHYDRQMSKIFFDDLNLPRPDINLDVGSHSQIVQIAKVIAKLEKVVLRCRPNMVVVVGDVNSTLAGALVASKLCIPIAHVEAGLRSFDRSMPEEVNRVVTDSLSDFLFTPSRNADENLKNEGISQGKIFFVGNVMIDTLLDFKDLILKNTVILKKLNIRKKGFMLLTLHRPSNVDKLQDLKKIFDIMHEIQKKIKIIFPMHPRTQSSVERFKLKEYFSRMRNVIMIKPLGYTDFLSLMSNSLFVMTDSGGIQEETTALGVPCLTVRENTERPVTITEGTNILVGTNCAKIVRETRRILKGDTKEGCMPELWDGKAAKRIAKILAN